MENRISVLPAPVDTPSFFAARRSAEGARSMNAQKASAAVNTRKRGAS
jgi:hypothetical protein